MAVFGVTFVSNEDGRHKDGYDTVDAWDKIDARAKFKEQHPTAEVISIVKVSD